MPKTILSLPPEILGEIFLTVSETKRPAQALFAGKLAAVCSQWRSIALSYPALWCYIYVVKFDLYPPLHTLALWIHRSGHNLLRVYTTSFDTSSQIRIRPAVEEAGEEQHFGAVGNMLAPTRYRWTSLYVRDIEPVNALQWIRFDLAKELRTLHIPMLYEPENVNDENHSAFLTSLFTMPQLTFLELRSDSHKNILQLAPNFSWNSLIRLDPSWDCPWEFIAQVVSQCISATYISIQVTQFFSDLNAFPKHIVLPNLEVLQIKYESTDALALVSSLQCLNLSVLRVEARLALRDAPPPAVHERPFDLLAPFLASGRHRI